MVVRWLLLWCGSIKKRGWIELNWFEWGPDLLWNQLQVEGSPAETAGRPLCYPGPLSLSFSSRALPVTVPLYFVRRTHYITDLLCVVVFFLIRFFYERRWSKRKPRKSFVLWGWLGPTATVKVVLICTSTWWVWCIEWEKIISFSKKKKKHSSVLKTRQAMHSILLVWVLGNKINFCKNKLL